MNMFDILEALCDNVAEKFSGHDIHINQVPEGFKRPSFYVTMIGFGDRDLSQGALKRTTAFQVVYFAPVDRRGIVDTANQYAAYMILSQIFQHHGLQVLDRNIKITSVDGGPRDKEVYLTINFEYGFSPEDMPNPEDLYQKMQELQVKYIN
jgi:hypothetical protein